MAQCQCWSSTLVDVWRLVNTFRAPNAHRRLRLKNWARLRGTTRCQKEPPEPMDVNHETLRILTNSRRFNIWGWWNQPSIQPHKTLLRPRSALLSPLCCFESIAVRQIAYNIQLPRLGCGTPGTIVAGPQVLARTSIGSHTWDLRLLLQSVLGIVGFQQNVKSIL